MRVLMTGGGTGGHVNPALAIAQTIREKESDAEIAFVGTSRGIENKLVPPEGYHLYHVESRGFKRSLSLSNLKSAYYALTSPGKARKILKEFRPDLVIGTGGYVSWPVCKAASEMGIPVALHESNAYPGATVRMLAPLADRIYINFEETAENLPKGTNLLRVGNPLRGQFARLTREEARKQLGIPDSCRYYILSYGGSMGAEKVNDAVLELMKTFTCRREDVMHIHATGSIEYEIFKGQFLDAGLDKCPRIEMKEYIFDMPLRMAAADLLINRAGAMTVSEIALMKKPSIFIPSPNVTNNHQFKNAKVLKDAGAAELVEEKDLPGELISLVEELLGENGEEKRREMSEKVVRFAVPDANERIYEDLKKLLEEKKHG
ncbi:MAG: undecaprenyldiphospho-muramoylpentapeptide beta-N-acetylglucosaminyltransferase [Clostridia bacterium]|nr:undecaprenyldiphospho-muramoylpentapeptide beta-N-acetylglucosaminyltransferase [Clostridia bacterium]